MSAAELIDSPAFRELLTAMIGATLLVGIVSGLVLAIALSIGFDLGRWLYRRARNRLSSLDPGEDSGP